MNEIKVNGESYTLVDEACYSCKKETTCVELHACWTHNEEVVWLCEECLIQIAAAMPTKVADEATSAT